jgi:hypothetical protein
MAGKAEIGPHRIGEESPSAFARFEIAHESGEHVGVLGDLDEALIDIDGVATRRDVAVDAGEPSIGRETEGPGIDRLRLDIGCAGAWPEIGAPSGSRYGEETACTSANKGRETAIHKFPRTQNEQISSKN